MELIIENNIFVVGLQSDHRRNSRSLFLLSGLVRKITACAIVPERLFSCPCNFPFFLEFFPRTETVVCPVRSDQLPDNFPVPFEAATLVDRRFIPVNTKPRKAILYLPDILTGRSLTIGILNSQENFAARSTCKQPVENSCTRTTDMQKTGGTWCKSIDRCHILSMCVKYCTKIVYLWKIQS